MKKFIFIAILFFNIMPFVRNGEWHLFSMSEAHAQDAAYKAAQYLNSLNDGNRYIPMADGRGVYRYDGSGNVSQLIYLSQISVPASYSPPNSEPSSEDYADEQTLSDDWWSADNGDSEDENNLADDMGIPEEDMPEIEEGMSEYINTCSTTASNTLSNYESQEQNDLNNFLSTDNNGNPNPSPCRGTKRFGNILWPGTVAHKIVQVYFQVLYPYAQTEYIIPGAGVKTNPTTGKTYAGYADIVEPSHGWIFEIKPDGSEADGLSELNNYVTKANTAGCGPNQLEGGSQPMVAWAAGTSAAVPPIYLPSTNPDKLLYIYQLPNYPGVISYKEVDKNTAPGYNPNIIPDNVKQTVDQLMQRLKNKLQQSPNSSVQSDANDLIPALACSGLSLNELKNFVNTANTADKAVRTAALLEEMTAEAGTAVEGEECLELLLLLLL